MAMLRYAVMSGGNAGRGINKLSLGGVRTVIRAQEAAARLFNVRDESNIIFTYNATYALNMAIMGTASGSDHITVSAMDHNSVLRPAALHGKFSVAAADRTGVVAPLSVRMAMRADTRLVVCTHISNVCGTRQPVAEISRAAHNGGAVFLLDASQSAGSAEVDMEKLGADMIACPGHKGLMGPMGSGILCVKDPLRLRAVIVGGTGSESESIYQPESMPDKFHSGTINLPAVAGLCEGIKFVLREGADAIGKHEMMLARRLREKLLNMDGVTVYGKPDSGITTFNINGIDSGECAALLGDNIIVRAGYHCAPLAHKALGSSVGGSVRASFGYFNTVRDADTVCDAIYRIVKRHRSDTASVGV